MPFNRVCTLSSFDPVRDDIKATHPQGEFILHRKYWEYAMAIRAFRHFGVSHPGARVLGVGAGHETTVYYLTRFVEQVYATDLYLTAGWEAFASAQMLTNPAALAPIPFDRQRLVVMHADALDLPFPDEFFDGIFSSGSIEHFGTMEQIAQSAAEMGRVLKPGGIIALSTELHVDNIDAHFANVHVFNADTLRRYVIEPTGCEMVDDPDYTVDDETRATAEYLNGRDWDMTFLPHVVLDYKGEIQFTSVSVVLRKPEVNGG